MCRRKIISKQDRWDALPETPTHLEYGNCKRMAESGFPFRGAGQVIGISGDPAVIGRRQNAGGTEGDAWGENQ